MNPSRLAMLHLRARLYTLIRQFFADRDVLEVKTPILSAAGNTEPNIESFRTHFTGHVDAGPPTRYLRTSPEYPLKRLLAEGLDNCYELGRVFRNGEAGKHHNPEFTMLEWYRTGIDHYQLAEETVQLVQAACQLASLSSSPQRRPESSQAGALSAQNPSIPVHITTYHDLFQQELGINPFQATIAELSAPLTDFDIIPDGLTHDDWLDLLLTHRIQPRFPRHRITVIHDWPATQCALARIRQDDPPVAERFELYLGPHELANGYHELNDAHEQRQRFECENARREQHGQERLPLDENLLSTLDAMPDCAGVAFGVERLLMCLLQTDHIADVMPYVFAKA